MRAHRHIERFERFRSGGGFLVVLSLFLVLWLVPNFYLRFDADNLTLNLLLSIEAAFAMPVLLMASAKRAEAESERLKEVLNATHELLRRLGDVAEDVDDIKEEVDSD